MGAALKKIVLILKIIIISFLSFKMYHATFWCRRPENMKKPPSKVAHNRTPTFFLCTGLVPKRPETEILYHQKPLNAGLGI